MFKRPGVPYFTPLGIGLFFAGLIIGGLVAYFVLDTESVSFSVQMGAFIGLAAMTIRWRIAEELEIKRRKEEDQES